MSREVTGNAEDDEASQARVPRWSLRGPVAVRVLLLLLVPLAAGLALFGLPGQRADGLRPAPTPSAAAPSPTASPVDPPLPTGSASAAPAPDVPLAAAFSAPDAVPGQLDRVRTTLTLTNLGAAPLVVRDLAVQGLGTVLADGVEGRVVPAGDDVALPLTVVADCAALLEPAVRVVVTAQDAAANSGNSAGSAGSAGSDVVALTARTRPADELVRLLDPVCPQGEPLSVAVTGTLPGEDGGLTVRLLNTGSRRALVVPLAAPDAGGARIVLDPPLPLDLYPGQAVTATLRVRLVGCTPPDPRPASEALSLEAQTRDGFTQVSGWPATAVEGLLRRLSTQPPLTECSTVNAR